MKPDTSSSSPQPATENAEQYFFRASAADFKKIPGSPVAYWLSEQFTATFTQQKVGDYTFGEGKNITSDNDRFLRLHWEVNKSTLGRDNKWLLYAKGGEFRKWYGNLIHVVNWSEDARRYYKTHNSGRIIPEDLWYREGITWTPVATSGTGFRYLPVDTTFDSKGLAIYIEDERQLFSILGLLNSKFSFNALGVLNPTLMVNLADVIAIPVAQSKDQFSFDYKGVVRTARQDWDNFETSWDFSDLPLLRDELKAETLDATWSNWDAQCKANIARMQELEEQNNRLWIDAYGLQDELTPEVLEEEITLARADPKKDMAAFLSYAVGCMFGRYSLDKPGLILANAGETVEDYIRTVKSESEAVTFMPDDDNIIPVLDGEWFEDDIVARFREFLRVTFGEETLRENIQFIEDSLGKDLRKYFVADFYKDHLKTYKKRPIYWLFQSPKKSFQALIYLHRYDRDTVNLLLNDYLREFQNKLQNRRKHLDEILASESTSARDKTAATKEQTKIDKALPELADWERDVIYPLASQRLEIDLDDGVKQNYPKFGKALAKVPGLS